MTTLTYVSSAHGDWCGIYIDGKLYIEGHSIAVWEWLDIVQNMDIQWTKQLEVKGDWLERYGSFPAEFSSIPEVVF